MTSKKKRSGNNNVSLKRNSSKKRSPKRKVSTKKDNSNFFIRLIRFISFSFFKYVLKPLYNLLSFISLKLYQFILSKIKLKFDQRRQQQQQDQEEELQEELKQEKKEKKVSQLKKRKTTSKFQHFKEIKHLQGDFSEFDNFIYQDQSTIGLILGARGTGKSAIGMSLLENFASKTKKNIYAMGFKPGSVPDWINIVDSIEEIDLDSVLLVDEGGIQFSSRNAMSSSNKLLSEILLIARHKDLSVIFITQNSSNLEVNIIRQADYLLLKPSSLLQKDFERKKIRDIYTSIEKDFKSFKSNKGLTYLYSNHYCGFFTNKLPSFWSEKVSKGYSDR